MAGVAGIQDALRRIWASGIVGDQEAIQTRTYNLVVFVSDQATAAATGQHIVELTAERPGRVIFVDVEPGEEDRVDVWVSATHHAVGGRQVYGELITLAVQGELRHEIHSTVVALLAPDLPVYLWWTGVLDVQDHLFLELCEMVDRILLDTASCAEGIGTLEDLAGLPSRLLVSDLSWARLTPWRRAVAAVWDVPILREPLRHIRSLDIHYIATGDRQNSERALLLAGWLGARLGWELVEAGIGPTGGYTTTWRQGDWQGKVEVVESMISSLPAGEIAGIFVQAGDHPPFTMLSLVAMPDLGCIECRYNTAMSHKAQVIHRFEPVSTAAALAEELDLGYDPVYRDALTHTAGIVRLSRTQSGKA